MSNPVVGLSGDMPAMLEPAVNTTEGTFLYNWYRLFQLLFDRTGGGNGIPVYNFAILSDAGVSQSTATPLVPILNFVTASGKGVVMPPALSGGEFLIVVNVTPSEALKVYPAPEVQINGLGINNPYTMNAGGSIAKPTVQIFWFSTAAQCYATDIG